MVGRKPVINTLNLNTIGQIKAERFLLGYASSLVSSKLFKKGTIRFSISQSTITLNYVIGGNVVFSSSFRYLVDNRNGLDRIIYKTQDFVINTFFNYEWSGLPMKYRDMGSLLGIKPQSAKAIVEGIMEKLNKSTNLLR